jgi:glycerophosphoryl diester phosphodiesterase
MSISSIKSILNRRLYFRGSVPNHREAALMNSTRTFVRTATFVVLIATLAILPRATAQEKGNPLSSQAGPAERRAGLLRPPRHGGVYVVAHRGAHQGIPENSLPAYQKAIDLGADFVEIDVRTTKDGKFVSVHNDSIDAYVAGASGKIRELTLAELRRFDIGLRIGPKWQGTRVPTFEEILDLCRGKIGIYLDLKDAPVPALVKIVQRYGMERDILWYASPVRLEQLQKLCPKCLPMPDPYREEMLPVVLKRLHPRVVASFCDRISPSFIKTCHEAGAIVIADETDPPKCWQQALRWGTDGIQTDRPAELIEFLNDGACR